MTMTDGSTKDLGVVVGRDSDPESVAELVRNEVDRIPRPVDGKDGLDGFGFDDLEFSHDGERGFTLKFIKGDRVKEWAFSVPVMLFRGAFDEAKTYAQADVVQFGGHLYSAKRATSMKPSEMGGDWTLVVRRGREGKQGPPGPPGAEGKPYKPGGSR